ncbi:hypothetical protein BD779DRAFT_77167 [Infundibulicybe gibba]|nr:hypothetical protein BD779DRAFT_77167 [Infundibulicybe gibba]
MRTLLHILHFSGAQPRMGYHLLHPQIRHWHRHHYFILVRLIKFRRHTRAISGNGYGQEYTSIITMMIESSAAYSVIGTACLITFGMGSPLSLVFADAATAAQQINEYLIIVRLAHGRAWEEDTVTTIHFKAREVNTISMSDSQIDLDSEQMAGGKPEEGVSGQIVYLR